MLAFRGASPRAHRDALVEVWRKGAQGAWEHAAAGGRGDRVPIASLGIELSVDDVYRDPTAA